MFIICWNVGADERGNTVTIFNSANLRNNIYAKIAVSLKIFKQIFVLRNLM